MATKSGRYRLVAKDPDSGERRVLSTFKSTKVDTDEGSTGAAHVNGTLAGQDEITYLPVPPRDPTQPHLQPGEQLVIEMNPDSTFTIDTTGGADADVEVNYAKMRPGGTPTPDDWTDADHVTSESDGGHPADQSVNSGQWNSIYVFPALGPQNFARLRGFIEIVVGDS